MARRVPGIQQASNKYLLNKLDKWNIHGAPTMSTEGIIVKKMVKILAFPQILLLVELVVQKHFKIK